MVAFARGRDLERYAGTLASVIDALVRDMARIARLAGCPFPEDGIIEAYARAAEGPTVIERVLIGQGRLTEAEAGANHVADMIHQGVAARAGVPAPQDP